MLNELQILEKHLGEANTDMMALKHETQQFVSDINDANDFSTALQLINKGLKAMLKACEGKDYEDVVTKVELANLCMKIVDESVYMNIALFDNSYLVKVGTSVFKFEIASPTKLLAKDDYAGMQAYMQDKLEESKKLLSELGLAIINSSPNEAFSSNHSFSSTSMQSLFK